MDTEPTIVEIEHDRYLDDARYRRSVHVQVIQAGEDCAIRPLHLEDRACCRRQSWFLTMFDMGHALREDGWVLDVEDLDTLLGR